jgi:hypothetical protein
MRRANEILVLVEQARGRVISTEELKELERRLNEYFDRWGSYFKITGTHFVQRLRRPENRINPVQFSELARILTAFAKKYASVVSLAGNGETGVIREDSTNINIGFIVDHFSKHRYEKDIELQTIMRSKQFGTSDPVYKVTI